MASSKQTKSPAKTLGKTQGSPSKIDVVSLKKSDIDRMLSPSLVMNAQDVEKAKKEATAKRDELQAVSKARKEKMLRLAEAAEKNTPEDESKTLKRLADTAVLSRAQQLLLEQKDEVKRMNQMILYSKCVTIRDAQIEEKRKMMQDNEEEERRQDLAMEVERVRALEQYEAREKQRVLEMKLGAKTIEDQIRKRERMRLLEAEKVDQERALMHREAEKLKEQELAAQIEKRRQAQELVKRVAQDNEEQIRRKEELKHREKEDDLKITAYIRAKEQREQEVLAEKERIARDKELETAKLRAMQERAADKQSEIDELRARRYQETKERESRNKELAQAEARQSRQLEMQRAREAQHHAKVRQQADLAQIEHNEFMRVLAVNRAKEHDEMNATATALAINERYKEELLAQIKANEERHKKSKQDTLMEGTKWRQEQALEAQRLAEIKAGKLKSLEAIGVPEKYRSELEKMKLGNNIKFSK